MSLPVSPRTRVLIVDDHADTRAMYTEYLGMQFDVDEAGTGARALQLAEQHRPDVVVADVTLPDLDGFLLVERLRASAGLSAVPVILLSGHSGERHQARARAANCQRVR